MTIMSGRVTERGRTSRPIADELAATGDLLFRWRSYLPLALVPLFALSVADSREPASFSYEIVCFAIGLLGLGLRTWIIGTAPEGTSRRGTSRPTAAQLNTSGAYSIVRHPLYIANTVMWLGCALLSATWYFPLLVVLLSFIYHERIAAREEAFLVSAFGDSFRTWVSDVPAMVPSFARYRPTTVRFQTAKALRQESHGLCALGTAFLLLDIIEDSMRRGRLFVDSRWLMIFVATSIPLVTVIIMNHFVRRTAAS
jgi:protein-S-isoprenylcysteine O-methyltransferase Ste14